MPVEYNLRIGGRLVYIFWGLFLGGMSLFLTLTLVSSTRPDRSWVEYCFVLLVITLWLVFAVTCLLKGLKSNPRIVVTEAGFSYSGVLDTRTYLWSNLVSIDWVYERGGFYWLKVTVFLNPNNTRSFKLDFTGLKPDRLSFVNQVRKFAPSAKLGLLERRSRIANIQAGNSTGLTSPDFEKLRKETRELTKAEGRDELLAELDQLEEAIRTNHIL